MSKKLMLSIALLFFLGICIPAFINFIPNKETSIYLDNKSALAANASKNGPFSPLAGSETPTDTLTSTATDTETSLPPTDTPTTTVTDTETPLPPTDTPTVTATATETPLPPTDTPTATATATETPLPPTDTPTATATRTLLPPTHTSTVTTTSTITPTITPTRTTTPTITATNAVTITLLPSTVTPSVTPALTPTFMPTISQVATPIDNENPKVNWVSPVGNGNGYYLTNLYVHLLVTATDNFGIAKVHIYRWDKVMLRFIDIVDLSNSPYEWNFDTSTLYYGWNEIDVKAYDTAGNLSDHQYIFLFRKAFIYLPFLQWK